jgi:hypothetical protein
MKLNNNIEYTDRELNPSIEVITKPIFTIGLKMEFEDIHILAKQLDNRFQDYHVLIYYQNVEVPNFQLFSIKDIKETTIEELKKLVMSKLP